MRHLDLFSGIGGFALAAQTVWGDEYENVGFCEIDRYCQELLKLRYPGSVIYDDIRKLTKEQIIKNSVSGGRIHGQFKKETTEIWKLRKSGARDRNWVCDLITGGFPCQPFSAAGKRKGTEDDRHLWPEMLRVISEVKPEWVIGENVKGITNISNGVVLKQIKIDLENIGYEVEMFIIPACAVNAPHRRDRVWILGYSNSSQPRIFGKEVPKEESIPGEHREALCSGGPSGANPGNSCGIIAKSCEQRCNNGGNHRGEGPISENEGIAEENKSERERRERRTCKVNETITHAGNEGLQGRREKRQKLPRLQNRNERNKRADWKENWLEVATELCGVDDGLPAELDGLKLSKAGHRVQRLKALGNAIVPQVAYEIMKAIKEVDG